MVPIIIIIPLEEIPKVLSIWSWWLFEKGSVIEYSVIEKRTDLMRVALAVCKWTFASLPSILDLIF